MHYNKVEICGVNTSKLKTLSDEEKKEAVAAVSGAVANEIAGDSENA